jgi:hypothetical protein
LNAGGFAKTLREGRGKKKETKKDRKKDNQK